MPHLRHPRNLRLAVSVTNRRAPCGKLTFTLYNRMPLAGVELGDGSIHIDQQGHIFTMHILLLRYPLERRTAPLARSRSPRGPQSSTVRAPYGKLTFTL